MQFIIVDLKRAFTEKNFFLAVSIGCVCMAIGLMNYIIRVDEYSSMQGLIAAQGFILPFIAPLLSAIPYSNMNKIEERSGYERLLKMKSSKHQYILQRGISNGIIGGLTLVLPIICFIPLCLVWGPYDAMQEVGLMIGVAFLFGVAYASLAYALTFFNPKIFLPPIIPQIIYLLAIYATPYLGLEKFYPPLMFSPWLLPGYITGREVFLNLIALIGIALMVTVIGSFYHYIANKEVR